MANVGKIRLKNEEKDDYSITCGISNGIQNIILNPDKDYLNQMIFSNYSKFNNKMIEGWRAFQEKMKEIDSYGEIISIQDAYEHGKRLMNEYEEKWEQYRKEEAEKLTLFLEEKDEEDH